MEAGDRPAPRKSSEREVTEGDKYNRTKESECCKCMNWSGGGG